MLAENHLLKMGELASKQTHVQARQTSVESEGTWQTFALHFANS